MASPLIEKLHHTYSAGFAMYFENLAASAYRPGYGYFSKFFTGEIVFLMWKWCSLRSIKC